MCVFLGLILRDTDRACTCTLGISQIRLKFNETPRTNEAIILLQEICECSGRVMLANTAKIITKIYRRVSASL